MFPFETRCFSSTTVRHDEGKFVEIFPTSTFFENMHPVHERNQKEDWRIGLYLIKRVEVERIWCKITEMYEIKIKLSIKLSIRSMKKLLRERFF